MQRLTKRLALGTIFASMLLGIVIIASISDKNEDCENYFYDTTEPAPNAVQETMSRGYLTKADRSIIFSELGAFIVKDEVVLWNSGTGTIDGFTFCMTPYDYDRLLDIIITTVSGVRLLAQKQPQMSNGFLTWYIIFPEALLPGETISFVMMHSYDPMARTVINSTSISVAFNHSLFLTSPYPAKQLDCKVALPNQARYMESTPAGEATGGKRVYATQNVAPFYHRDLYFKFDNPDGKLIETEIMKLTLRANANTDWLVTNQLTVKNLGKNQISLLTFTVPSDAYSFEAKDKIGSISGFTIPDDSLVTGNKKNITLTLTVNRYSITTGNKFSFTLSYLLPAGPRVSLGDDKNILTIDIFQLCTNPWLMHDVDIQIALPQATNVNFNQLNLLPESADNIDGVQYLIYKSGGVSCRSSGIVILTYDYSSLSLQSRPLLIAVVVALVLVAFISIRKSTMIYTGKETTVTPTEIPIEELKLFCETFEEKVALFIEMEALNDDYKRRRLKKREYNIRMDDCNKQLRELNAGIKEPKKGLVDFGGRFKEIIDELDVLEAEHQSIQDSLIALEFRYKEGKISSRSAFEKLFDDMSTKLKQIKNAIDSGLNELKGYYV